MYVTPEAPSPAVRSLSPNSRSRAKAVPDAPAPSFSAGVPDTAPKAVGCSCASTCSRSRVWICPSASLRTCCKSAMTVLAGHSCRYPWRAYHTPHRTSCPWGSRAGTGDTASRGLPASRAGTGPIGAASLGQRTRSVKVVTSMYGGAARTRSPFWRPAESGYRAMVKVGAGPPLWLSARSNGSREVGLQAPLSDRRKRRGFGNP